MQKAEKQQFCCPLSSTKLTKTSRKTCTSPGSPAKAKWRRIKIKSEEGVWSIRVGEYRVAYIVDDKAKVVTIICVGPRGDFYN